MFQIDYPYGSLLPLKKFVNQDVNITLPPDLNISDIKYLSVWSRKLAEDFGHEEFHMYDSSAVLPTAPTMFVVCLMTMAAYFY